MPVILPWAPALVAVGADLAVWAGLAVWGGSAGVGVMGCFRASTAGASLPAVTGRYDRCVGKRGRVGRLGGLAGELASTAQYLLTYPYWRHQRLLEAIPRHRHDMGSMAVCPFPRRVARIMQVRLDFGHEKRAEAGRGLIPGPPRPMTVFVWSSAVGVAWLRRPGRCVQSSSRPSGS